MYSLFSNKRRDYSFYYDSVCDDYLALSKSKCKKIHLFSIGSNLWYSSWQKGAIENTNKLIREYIPKQVNFDDYTDKKIAMIQMKINNRPRQKLNFGTQKNEFYKRILYFCTCWLTLHADSSIFLWHLNWTIAKECRIFAIADRL